MRHTLTILILLVFISTAAGHGNSGVTRVKMLNSSEWFAVGYDGLFAKTTDAGSTWTSRKVADGVFNLWDITFFNSTTGIIAGVSDQGETYIARTTNGGDEWTRVISPANLCVTPMTFANERVGFLYGTGPGMGSSIYKTTNGGLEWFRTNPYPLYYSVNSIYTLDTNNVYAGLNDGYILYSPNGGNTWQMLDTDRPDDIMDVCFTTQNTGVYCSRFSFNDKGKQGKDGWYLNFGKTTNKGQSWSVKWIQESDNYAMKYSQNTFYVIGDYNRILRTNDYGDNWSYFYYDVPLNSSPSTIDVKGTNILVGGYGPNGGTLIKSSNNGANWTFMTIPLPYVTISGFARYSDNGQPIIAGKVKAFKYDRNTANIIVFDSSEIEPNGAYTLAHVPQDTVDIGVYPNSQPVRDFIISYYPGTSYWYQMITLYPTGNMTNVNIYARRINLTAANNSVSGRIARLTNAITGYLKDAVISIKNGDTYVGCAISDNQGIYHVTSLPAGNLKVVVDRIGFKGDSLYLNVTSTSNIDSVNFYLNRLIIGIRQISESVPVMCNLYQNYPNPFNPSTKIKFDIPKSSSVQGLGSLFTTMKIYDAAGKELGTLLKQNLNPGTYEVEFNGSALPSGVYFYSIITGDFVSTKKMMLIK
ncbi:MAG: T9SS type A sorting domain-containing protein [Bacteroidetes bacterium]|nr:T9SS type A sorting domain-containing protein [Bacteroidota bacterium]